jgi:hypothetical protein
MKTSNYIFKSVVIAVVAMFTASANAQTKLSAADAAHIQDQREKVAFVAGADKGRANCYEYEAPKVENGLVTEVVGVKHPRVTLSLAGGFSSISGKSEDLGSQTASSGTAEFTAEYRAYHAHNGKDAKVGFYGALSATLSSQTTMENLKAYSYGLLVDAGVVINPCGKAQLTIAGTAAYLNSVSQEVVSNDAIRGNIDFKSNPLYLGGMVKASYTVGYITRRKEYNIKGQKITGVAKTPIELFVKGRIGTTEIGKPKVNGNTFTWSGVRTSVFVGLTLGL